MNFLSTYLYLALAERAYNVFLKVACFRDLEMTEPNHSFLISTMILWNVFLVIDCFFNIFRFDVEYVL